jgi:hypothetical protein
VEEMGEECSTNVSKVKSTLLYNKGKRPLEDQGVDETMALKMVLK